MELYKVYLTLLTNFILDTYSHEFCLLIYFIELFLESSHLPANWQDNSFSQ